MHFELMIPNIRMWNSFRLSDSLLLVCLDYESYENDSTVLLLTVSILKQIRFM